MQAKKVIKRVKSYLFTPSLWIYFPRTLLERILHRYYPYALRKEVSCVSQAETIKNEGPVLVCLIRNGIFFLPSFFEHYRNMQIGHFVFMDNGSDDGTLEYLSDQPDCTVYSSKKPFKVYQQYLRRYLMQEHTLGKWVITVDSDELLDFAGSAQRPLPELLGYLKDKGYTAVMGHMLDMYSDQPLLKTPELQARKLLEIYPFYSVDRIIREPYERPYGADDNDISEAEADLKKGGVVRKKFGVNAWLTKHPIFYHHEGIRLPIHPHDIGRAKVADFTVVLLHFKFTSEFSRILDYAISKNCYAGGSFYYRAIHSTLNKDPDLKLMNDATCRWEGAEILVEQDFLYASEAFREWANLTLEGK